MARRMLPNGWEEDVAHPSCKQPAVSNTPYIAAIRRPSSSVADYLNCAICLQFYEVPKNMPQCGHVFCLKCLQRMHKPTNAFITCPQCRQANALEKIGVEGFQTNVAISGAVEAMKAQQRKQEEAKATSTGDVACCHDGDSVPCPHCNRHFCQICSIVHMERLKIEALKKAENIFSKSAEISNPALSQYYTCAVDRSFFTADAAVDQIAKELRSTFEQILSGQLVSVRKEIGQLRAFKCNQNQEHHARLMADMGELKEVAKNMQSKSVLDMDLHTIGNAYSEISIRETMMNSLLAFSKPGNMPILGFESSKSMRNNLAHALSAERIGTIHTTYSIVPTELPALAKSLPTLITRDYHGPGPRASLATPGPQQPQKRDIENKLTSPEIRTPLGTCQAIPVRPNDKVMLIIPGSANTPQPVLPKENVAGPSSTGTSGAANSNQLVVRYPLKHPQEQCTSPVAAPTNSAMASSSSLATAKDEPSSSAATSEVPNTGQHPKAQSNVIVPDFKSVTCLASWIQPNRKLFIAAHDSDKISLIDSSGKIVGTFRIVEINTEGAQPLQYLEIDCVVGCRDKDILYYTCSYRKQQDLTSTAPRRAICKVNLSNGNFNARRRFKIVSGPDCPSSYRGVAFSNTWQVILSSSDSETLFIHGIAQPTVTKKVSIDAPHEGRFHVLALHQVDDKLAWLFCLVKTTLFRVDISKVDSDELRFEAVVKPHQPHSIFPLMGQVTRTRFCLVDKTLFASNHRYLTAHAIGSSVTRRLESYHQLPKLYARCIAVLPIDNGDRNFVVAEKNHDDNELVLFPITCIR